MARDSAVGRDRILIVPGNLALDNSATQHGGGAPTDLNQQIIEVSQENLYFFPFLSISSAGDE